MLNSNLRFEYMSQTLLYYPSINIPDRSWIVNSILYTDKISTILPFTSIEDDRISEEIKQLYSEGVYQPLFIENELKSNEYVLKGLNAFESSFIETINSSEFNTFKTDYLEKKGIKLEDSLIYNNKITENIRDYLLQSNLLEYSNKDEVFVDRFASVYYLCKLAHFLSEAREDNIIPCTDNMSFEEICFKPDTRVRDRYALRIILSEILYTIPKETPISTIMKFKRKRKDEFLEFNIELTDIITRLSNLTFFEQKSEIEKLNKRIELIRGSMKNMFKKSWNNFKEKAISVSSLMVGTGVGEVLDQFNLVPAKFALPAATVAFAALSSLFSERYSRLESNSLRYLYHVKKSFKGTK